MLLTIEQMSLLECAGPKQFKACDNLTEEQKAELLALDKWHYSLEDEHLIVNYKDLESHEKT